MAEKLYVACGICSGITSAHISWNIDALQNPGTSMRDNQSNCEFCGHMVLWSKAALLPEAVALEMIANPRKLGDRTIIQGKHISVDGARYEKTNFVGCTFLFAGKDSFAFLDCRLLRPQWVFIEDAKRTLLFMSQLYRDYSGGKELVEEVFNQIRAGTLPPVPAGK